jgi:hypothetical protein
MLLDLSLFIFNINDTVADGDERHANEWSNNITVLRGTIDKLI